MKKFRYIPLYGLLLCLLIGLCACSGKAETPDSMEFKGIPWNASVEEVCQALELEFDPAMWEEESERGGTLRLENWDAFGQTAQFVYFNFANFTDDPTVPLGLCQVHFFYTADCDQQALLDALRAASFISETQTDRLVEKTASLAGSLHADVLKQNIVAFNVAKTRNEDVFRTIKTEFRFMSSRRFVSGRSGHG